MTGSSGGVGTILVPHLLERGFKVIGLDVVEPRYPVIDSRFIFIKGSIIDPGAQLEGFKNSIDYIVHLAALSSLPECESDPLEAMKINFLGTVNLVNYFLDSKLQGFVNASTSAIYENNSEYPFSETFSIDPHLIYPQSKLISENYLRAQKKTRSFPSISLRFFNIIGPYQDYERISPPLVNYIIREFVADRRPTLYSDGEQRRDYISVYDACEAIIMAFSLCSSRENVFNICSGETLSVKDIVGMIQTSMGVSIEPSYNPPDLLWEKYDNLFRGKYSLDKRIVKNETTKLSVGDHSKFAELTKWFIRDPISDVITKVCSEAVKFMNKE